MSRHERRNEERKADKIKNKMYTYAECVKIAHAAVLEVEKQYDVRYALCLAMALNSKPLKFGKVRVCRTVGKFFEQVDELKNGKISEEEVRKKVLKLGVKIVNDNETLSVYIDPTLKF